MKMAKRIQLTLNKFAIVDDEDHEWLNKNVWYAHKQGNTYYAKRTTSVNNHVIIVHMHREVLGLGVDNGSDYVDHIDRNGLNNQRSNLRICTKSQNGISRPAQSNNTSGYKGVTWDKTRKKWKAQIMLNQKGIFIGRFNTPEEAATAYDKKAIEIFGEFAYTNFDYQED